MLVHQPDERPRGGIYILKRQMTLSRPPHPLRTYLRQDLRVDKQNVAHSQKCGDTRPDLGGHGGMPLVYLEELADGTMQPPLPRHHLDWLETTALRKSEVGPSLKTMRVLSNSTALFKNYLLSSGCWSERG